MPDDRDRRKTPSAGVRVTPPTVSRTPTPHELAAELRALRLQLQRPDIEKRLDRVEQVANADLLPFIRETGARYTEVTLGLAHLSKQLEANTRAFETWRAEVRDQFADHDDRLLVVEERGTTHEARWAALEDEQLPARVRSLERHQTATNTELALTRRQKGGVAALGTIGGALAALLSRLFGG